MTEITESVEERKLRLNRQRQKKFNSANRIVRIDNSVYQNLKQIGSERNLPKVQDVIKYLTSVYPPHNPSISNFMESRNFDSWELALNEIGNILPSASKRKRTLSKSTPGISQPLILYSPNSQDSIEDFLELESSQSEMVCSSDSSNYGTDVSSARFKVRQLVAYKHLKNECNVSTRKIGLVVAICKYLFDYGYHNLISYRTFGRILPKLCLVERQNVSTSLKKLKSDSIGLKVDSSIYGGDSKLQICVCCYDFDSDAGKNILLKVESMENKTGISQANAVMSCFYEYGLSYEWMKNTIKYVISDRAKDLVGTSTGLIVTLEKELNKKLVYISCDLHNLNRAFVLGMRAAWSTNKLGNDFGTNNVAFSILKRIATKIRCYWSVWILEIDEHSNKIPQPAPTRWSSVGNTTKWIVDNLIKVRNFMRCMISKKRTLSEREPFKQLVKELSLAENLCRIFFISEFHEKFLFPELEFAKQYEAFRCHEMPGRSYRRLQLLSAENCKGFISNVEIQVSNFLSRNISLSTKQTFVQEAENFFYNFKKYIWEVSGYWWLKWPLITFSLGTAFRKSDRYSELFNEDDVGRAVLCVISELNANAESIQNRNKDFCSAENECQFITLDPPVNIPTCISLAENAFQESVIKGEYWESLFFKVFREEIRALGTTDDFPMRTFPCDDSKLCEWIKTEVWGLTTTTLDVESNFSLLNRLTNLANGAYLDNDMVNSTMIDKSHLRGKAGKGRSKKIKKIMDNEVETFLQDPNFVSSFSF